MPDAVSIIRVGRSARTCTLSKRGSADSSGVKPRFDRKELPQKRGGAQKGGGARKRGRARKEDAVRPTAGVRCLVKPGDFVRRGQETVELAGDDEGRSAAAVEVLAAALSVSDQPRPPAGLVVTEAGGGH